MKNTLFLICLLLLGFIFSGFQEEKTIKDNPSLKNALSGSALRKFNRAQKLIGKAKLILDEAERYEQQIEEIKQTSKRARSRKMAKLEQKKMEKEIEAFYAFEMAHKKLYQAYQKTLKGFRELSADPAKGIDLEKSARLNYRRARKFRNKAENKKSEDKVYKLLSDAYDFEIDAINNQIEAFENYRSSTAIAEVHAEPELQTEEQDTVSTQTEPVVTDSVIYTEPEIIIEESPEILSEEIDSSDLEMSITDTLIIPEVEKLPIEKKISTDSVTISYLKDTVRLPTITIPAKKTEETIPPDTLKQIEPSEEKIKPEIEKQPRADSVQAPIAVKQVKILFSIQILAKTSPASLDQLYSIYNGEEEVFLRRSGDYYRYMVGKFKTLFEAKIFKNKEKIEGFIVAYKNSERITIKEATEIIRNR